MCAIIDSCVATKVFIQNDDPNLGEIWQKIRQGHLIVVYGGKLVQEYAQTKNVAKVIKALDQAGIAKKVSDNAVNQEDSNVKSLGICKSNDTHVIALARVSKARLLCSADISLHNDFKNKKLIDKPRGSIYQNIKHNRLLNRKCIVCKKIG